MIHGVEGYRKYFFVCVFGLVSVSVFAFFLCYSFKFKAFLFLICSAETVRSALDVLAICSVMPQVQLLFCEQVTMPDEAHTVGMNIILGAAEGEIVADADVQRSALSVIINSACAPVHRVCLSLFVVH